ncbi:MAG: SagB/ThcOx family dehydrogenase [Candidatus Celaenobacter antarcticus]|nr:SagB/ThcOx family dehydrogenase [Candidatus Celaenobacter antarcticus]
MKENNKLSSMNLNYTDSTTNFSTAETFHENTKQWNYEQQISKIKTQGKTDYVKRLILNQNLHNTSELTKIIAQDTDKYKGFTSIPLNNKIKDQSNNLINIITERKSVRKFTGNSLDVQELTTLLYSYKTTTKIERTDIYRRTIPSGGALYPVELYLTLPTNIDKEIIKGTYYYNSNKHSLVIINNKPRLKEVRKFLFQPDLQINKSAAIFYITGILNKSSWKYGDRAYRYMLLEAGHLAQNLLLITTSLNLGSCPIGGFNDNMVNDYLYLDSINEVTLYIIIIGKI